MKKRKNSFMKEISIFMLLLILIILILAVALYDFIPANINIPETVSYSADSTTTSIKQEIAYTNGGDVGAGFLGADSELVTSLKSYSIDSSDLAVYGEKNLYNSGNSNPFDYAEEASTIQNAGNTGSQTNTQSNNTNSNTATNTAGTTTTNATSANTTNSNSGTFFEKPNSK